MVRTLPIPLLLALIVAGSILVHFAVLGLGLIAFQLPSIVVPALVAYGFGRTLRAQREPLITRIAREARGPLPPELLVYTRRLTAFWAIALALLAAASAALAMFASHRVWSWLANFGSYALIGTFVVGEYFYRRQRFPDYPHPSFNEYVAILVRADYRERAP